jgi:hypothetical protein
MRNTYKIFVGKVKQKHTFYEKKSQLKEERKDECEENKVCGSVG